MLNLPSKDKNGNSFLSYSQISTFKNSRDEYYKRYIKKEPFVSNEYIDFGLNVGKSLETGDFSNFSKPEQEILKTVTRLDLFERKVILDFPEFYMIGFVDTCSNDLNTLIDYKTGGKNKEFEYTKSEYTQMCYYALSIRQETGKTPENAIIEFIRRSGNLYRGEKLVVANEPVIRLNNDISYERLKFVYNQTLVIAKEIESFYLESIL